MVIAQINLCVRVLQQIIFVKVYNNLQSMICLQILEHDARKQHRQVKIEGSTFLDIASSLIYCLLKNIALTAHSYR